MAVDATSPRVLVVGGGAAGLAAAFAAAWRGARVQLLDALGPGGQLQNVGVVETVPGIAPTTGPELVEQLVSRLEGLPVPVETIFGVATGLERRGGELVVSTDTGDELHTDIVIVATGSKPQTLGVPGEAEFENRGVSHCAACDGPLYRGRPVVVVGGGDGAADAALALRDAGTKITLVHRGRELDAAAALRQRIEAMPEIEVLLRTEVAAIGGDQTVSHVVLRSGVDGSETKHATAGVFTAVGTYVEPGAFATLLEHDDHGRLLVDVHLATSVAGVFAAGSVRHGSSDQLSAALGDGASAAVSALRWWNGDLELEAPTGKSETQTSTTTGSAPVYSSYSDFFDDTSSSGLGDGFPLVPLTDKRIGRFLDSAGLDGQDVLDDSGVIARDVAACAVAAGCSPEYAGVVVAGARSMLADIDRHRAFLPDSVLATVVNGPARLQIDLNCSDGIFGPGWRANASIGRALRLLATGPLGIPLSTGFGNPGQYTFCFGEDEEKSDWTPLHVERGLSAETTAVTVFPAPVYRQVMDRAHSDSAGVVDFLTFFLRGRASGTGLFGSQPLSLMIVIGQELRRHLTLDYTKATLREALYERATADDGTPLAPLRINSPEDIVIVASGGVAFPVAWVFTAPMAAASHTFSVRA
jgi:thioredoxin reductase (NADPH)